MQTLMIPFTPRYFVLTACAILTVVMFSIAIALHEAGASKAESRTKNRQNLARTKAKDAGRKFEAQFLSVMLQPMFEGIILLFAVSLGAARIFSIKNRLNQFG